MIRTAIDENGQRVHVSQFRSGAEAHSKKHTYKDEYGLGLELTPCIYDNPHTSHFRIVTHIGNGAWGFMKPEHIFAQRQFEQKFINSKTFWVAYYARIDGKPKRVEVNLREYYDQCIIESPLGRRRSDILLKSSTHMAPPIMIEVWFSHRCEQEKIEEGSLIIEFRIKDYGDIFQRVKSWGLIEDFLNRRNPDVRFHNFRERQRELPWIKVLPL